MSTEIYPPYPQGSAFISHRIARANGRLHPDSITKPSPWCTSVWKRLFDLACVVPALILILPLLGILTIIVRLTSTGPAIFRQQRVGQHRKLFTIYKFRTMVENSEAIGPEHTAKGDPRITLVGTFLRRFKLDELPQLYNVLRGDMSLVGPRPKLLNHDYTRIACRPGVTGAATLAFRCEQQLLSKVPAEHLHDFYREHVLPCKIQLDADYISQATLTRDIGILFATVLNYGKCLTYQDLLVSSHQSFDMTSSQSRIVAYRL